MIKTNLAAQELKSTLTIEELRKTMGMIKKEEILIAITARPEIKDYLLEGIPTKVMNKTDIYFNQLPQYCGVEFYTVSSQKEPVKYWYNNQKEELNEYLKNNP